MDAGSVFAERLMLVRAKDKAGLAQLLRVQVKVRLSRSEGNTGRCMGDDGQKPTNRDATQPEERGVGEDGAVAAECFPPMGISGAGTPELTPSSGGPGILTWTSQGR